MLNEKNDFCNLLKEIQKDLLLHHKAPDELMFESVRTRLNSALKNYMFDISNSTDYLSNRNSETIFRRITKD